MRINWVVSVFTVVVLEITRHLSTPQQHTPPVLPGACLGGLGFQH